MQICTLKKMWDRIRSAQNSEKKAEIKKNIVEFSHHTRGQSSLYFKSRPNHSPLAYVAQTIIIENLIDICHCF